MQPARTTACSEGPLAVGSVLDLIGRTPMIELERIRDGVPAGVVLRKTAFAGADCGGEIAR